MKKGKLFYVICDNIRSRYNVGSIFRTADGAGVDRIFLCGITPAPPHPKIEKVSLGAEKTMPWEKCRQVWRVIEKLKKDGFFILALENKIKNAENIFNFSERQNKIALIIGSEVSGISPVTIKRCDKIVYISMCGKKESLNVAVAFGIAAYQINLKNKKYEF
ncbi:MAG: TrmH family RNA methyltransferase [Patescibacteria group bacterium]